MTDFERRRLVPMMKDNETTTKSDYVTEKLQPLVITELKPKPPGCYMIRPASLKYLHTMKHWATPSVPFNLYWKEETDIDKANPHIPQKHYQRPINYDREHVQKTRPRLVMTPSVALDVIEEPRRQTVIDDVYLSSTEQMLRQPLKVQEAKEPKLRVKAPFPETYAPALPLAIPKLDAPYVSPEWRMETISWDEKSLRTYCVPTREFWLRKGRKNEAKKKNTLHPKQQSQ